MHLSISTFGEQTERKAKTGARKALEDHAAREGLRIVGKVTYDADEKMTMWWNCTAEARVERT